jgi:ABC-2 type transport system permease protein
VSEPKPGEAPAEPYEPARTGEAAAYTPDEVPSGMPARPVLRAPTRRPPAPSTRAYRPERTLPLRVELERQLRRRRTQVVFGLVTLLPVLLWVAFELAPDGPPTGSLTLVDLATGSGLNFAVFALFASSSFLLVVVVALFFGDTVAAEASWSSLRYLLAAPVPRARLLRQKALVAALLSVTAVLLLPVVSLVVGTLAYGAGDLVSPAGVSLDYGPATGRLLAGAVYLAVHLSWVAGLALLLSVSTDAPLGAVGGAVLVSIVSQILDQITALEGLRDYLPTHFGDAWAGLLGNPVDWGDMTRGTFSALAYALVLGATAAWRFHTKDITS